MRKCNCPDCVQKRADEPMKEFVRTFEKELHDNNQIYYLMQLFPWWDEEKKE